MTINLQAKHLEVNQLVLWLADTVYPEDEPREAQKRVRSRIRYSAKIGQIKLIHRRSKEYVESPKFFTWARSKWPLLADMAGIPTEDGYGEAALELPAFECASFGVNIPNDIDELRKTYVNAETERYRLQLENDQLRGTVTELEHEVTRWREKYAQISKKNRESGSKGGRGKSY